MDLLTLSIGSALGEVGSLCEHRGSKWLNGLGNWSYFYSSY